jgi:Holliday junction DNA helicase RuvB
MPRIAQPEPLDEDRDLDLSLRPATFDDFVGQLKVKQQLQIFIQAARERHEALDHCLFYGPPGLGKTTLAYLVTHGMGTQIHVTTGPVLERPADLAGVLTNLQDGDILFIDEVHRLSSAVEEYLYPAMEEFKLEILIDRGAAARTLQLTLPRFTLVGATTRAGLLTSPFLARFGMSFRLDYYSPEELQQILNRSVRILGVSADTEALREIAGRSRGTPRVTNRLLRRIRDVAQVRSDGHISRAIARDALELLEIDARGFDEMDKRLMRVLIEKYRGGPVGLGTLAVTVGEDEGTLEEIYEPYLIREGFLERTPRGRKATRLALDHFGYSMSQGAQENLL